MVLWSLCQPHAKTVIEAIKNKRSSLEFIEQHKKGKNDFIRNRNLNFLNCVLFILQQGKSTHAVRQEFHAALFFVKEGLIALFTGASLNMVITYRKEKILKNILTI